MEIVIMQILYLSDGTYFLDLDDDTMSCKDKDDVKEAVIKHLDTYLEPTEDE